MSILIKLFDKLFIKQWSIGLAYGNKETVLREGLANMKFTWLSISKDSRFYADPFLVRDPSGDLYVLYEDIIQEEYFGKIYMSKLDKDFNIVTQKEMLNTGSHLSYPFVIEQYGKKYVMPEAGKSGQLYAYEIDFDQLCLSHRRTIIPDIPLLDSTICNHEGMFWLFATKRGVHSNSQLHLYHSEKWDGPYVVHTKNPVKDHLDGTRPAGTIFEVDGQKYRPTQNSMGYYGKSITINKILELNASSFKEVPHIRIGPPQNTKFNYAIHTINFSGNVIVIDGLRRIFNPIEQIRIFFKKKLK